MKIVVKKGISVALFSWEKIRNWPYYGKWLRWMYVGFVRIACLSLFAYSGTEKVADFKVFRIKMYRQPLPDWMNHELVYVIPALELAIALLLALPTKVWPWALKAFALLIGSFMIYATIAAIQPENHQPCACGGFLEDMPWWVHAVFNTTFTALACGALYLLHKYRHNPLKVR